MINRITHFLIDPGALLFGLLFVALSLLPLPASDIPKFTPPLFRYHSSLLIPLLLTLHRYW